MSEWQPIETAPKDATLVDVWAYWPDTKTWRRTPDAWFDPDIEGGMMKEDWKLGQFYRYQFAMPPRITHWMPRPTPPPVDNPVNKETQK